MAMTGTNLFTLLTSSEMIGTPEDVGDLISILSSHQTKVLNLVGVNSFTATQPIHTYQEIQDRPTRTTVYSACTATAGTVVFTDDIYSIGEIVTIGAETMSLDAVFASNAYTVTRSVGAVAASTHAAGVPAKSAGAPRVQGKAGGTTSDRIVQQAQVTNYTQIFSKDIVVSNTANVLDRYGRPGTEVTEATRQQFVNIMKEIEEALFWGVAQAAATTATAGKFAGAYERIANISGNTANSGAAISIDQLEDDVEAIADWGGAPNMIVCGLYEKRVLDAMGQPHIQHVVDPMDPTVMSFGRSVDRMFIGGAMMDVIVRPEEDSNLWVLSRENLRLGPLQGRSLSATPLAPDGDRQKSLLVTELTCEVPVPRSHRVRTGVATT